MRNLPQVLLIAGVSLLLGLASWCGYEVHTLSQRQEQVKTDYSTINNITFGLLSVSAWRDRIVEIVDQRMRHFSLTPGQKTALRNEISQVLHSLIDKMIAVVEHPQKTPKGRLRKLAFNTFVNRDKLYQLVPVFTNDIMHEIEKPTSKQRISQLLKSKLQQWEKSTYDSSRDLEGKVIDSLMALYNVRNITDFNRVSHADLSRLRRTTYHFAFGLLSCIVLILSLWWLLRNKTELHATLYILSILSAMILLLVGLTTTMIEIDARIRFLDFHLLGEDVTFRNQVLFFQSKSIVDVVKILLQTGKYDAVIVGMMILCFSIFFPISKLLSAGIYLLSSKPWVKNKVIIFFAFKSGKWSMADVMVVAILMTYIGFNGIVDSELSGLNTQTATLTSITTNHTSLQPGYIVFTGFVLYGLILSQILKTITNYHQTTVSDH